MNCNTIKDVPAWQAGVELTVKVFEITQNAAFRERSDIVDQLQRAALAVPNNLAEGFERGTPSELIRFLYCAKSAAGEAASICHVLENMAPFKPLRAQISDLKMLAYNISHQLGDWAFSLQEPDSKDSRHLRE